MANNHIMPPAVMAHIERETKTNPFIIQVIVASLINAITLEVEKGNEVTINPLGKFALCSRKLRKLHNSGAVPGSDTIPACKVLRFIPCRKIKKYINRIKKEG